MKDPMNIVVAGVGGQGNVMASLLLGAMLTEQGYKVTIGETYGASQRGGSVMSHVRISETRQYGPLMPPGAADLVIALEPTEAARVLGQFGSPETICVVNTRPVQPVDVIAGDLTYPDIDSLLKKIESLSKHTYFLSATDTALELGNPVLANIILIGALAGADLLPITEDGLTKAVSDYMSAAKTDINLQAFRAGRDMVA
jgi:indolepyruvate ferredoxin oxidoreductase beta subunit